MENLIKQDLFQYIWNAGEENNTQERVSKDTGCYSMKNLSLPNNEPNFDSAVLKVTQNIPVHSIL